MKILLLIDGMGIGGAETHVLTLVSALIKEGETVDVMCAGGAYTEALMRAGASVYFAPFKGRDLRSILKSIFALRQCRRMGYEAVHAHTRYTAALANFCLPRLPLITTVHLNFSLTRMKRSLTCWGRKTLAVSSDLKDYLVDAYGISERDILLTKNAVDPKIFSPLIQRGSCILHVSRLDKDRSLTAHLLCAIAPALHKRYPDRTICIIGDGDDREALQREAERANRLAGSTVVFLAGGTCSVSDALGSGALLIGVSRAVLEGASRALPIILSGNDGYGGILTEEQYETRKRDNFCCRGCKAATAEKLLADICFLLDHRCFCENLRQKISKRVQRDFLPKGMALDAQKAYRSALRIGIIGYYGFGNFGDEAMLLSLCRILRKEGIEQIHPLCKSGKPPVLSRAHFFRAVRMLRKCDIVLFGGGNLLQNKTSSFSFFYYAALLLFCRKQTIIGVGMGIGELNGALYKRTCGLLLKRFSLLYMRTQADASYALQISPNLNTKIRTGCDPCLFLPQSIGISRIKKILAIPKGEPDAAMLRFLKRKKAEGYCILPLILFPAQDRGGAKKIALLFGTPAAIVQTAEDFYQASKDAALCISERLHGAVFSLLSHTFCLLSAGSQKNIAFSMDVAAAGRHCEAHPPVQCYQSAEDALEKEREAEEKNLSFSEIISFLTKR